MKYNNPIHPSRLDDLLDELWLNQDSVILDVGGGSGELVKRIIERFGCQAVIVEVDEVEIMKAQENLKEWSSRVTFYPCAFKDTNLEPDTFDACFAIGSSHAFLKTGHAFVDALSALKQLTKTSGVIVLGEAYWRNEPNADYLAATGIDARELQSHGQNIEVGATLNLECLYSIRASYEEWDHFEGAHCLAVKKALLANADNVELVRKAQSRRKWRQAYYQWGRDTMGFSLYVFVHSDPAL